MPIISFIPDKYKEGFKKIASIEEDEFNSIETGLTYTSLVSSINVLAKKVADIQGLNLKTVEKIFISIGSLISALDSEKEIPELVENIANVAIDTKIFESESRNIFVKRLSSLLSNKQIYYASKSHYLSLEKENIYIGSRIITDIRPVFDVDLKDSPKGGMIMHTLHIHYRADAESDHKDIFISLKAEDIQSLKENIDRAERKETSLRGIFEKIGMTNLNE